MELWSLYWEVIVYRDSIESQYRGGLFIGGSISVLCKGLCSSCVGMIHSPFLRWDVDHLSRKLVVNMWVSHFMSLETT